jgi:hypothetical protein
VDEARVREDKTGYALSVVANGVTNNLRFNHRTVEEQLPDFTWFLNEMVKRTTIPRENFMKCAICGLDWGMCSHAGNNPVCVDNEVMRMVYEKLDMPVPVYPPGWADFWYATRRNKNV